MEYIGLLQDINLSSSNMLLLSIMTLKSKLLLRFGWYRIWSDKWIEQGALSAYPQLSAGVTGVSTSTLLKPYRNTLYNCVITITSDGGNSWEIKAVHVNLYTTYFQFVWASRNYSIASTNGRFNYVTQGY